jgi:hypothetical protein
MKALKLFIYLFACIALLSGCESFKQVGTFTACSQQSLQSVTLPYGGYKFCEDSCFIRQAPVRNLNSMHCDCRRDSVRDTIILNEFTTLSCYYAALSKLAGTSTMDFTPIARSLSAGKYGSITITDNEAGIFNKLSIAVTSLVTMEYKSRKLHEFITANDPGVQQAIGILKNQLTNLQIDAGNISREYRIAVRSAIDSTSDKGERLLLVNMYQQKKAQLDAAWSGYENLKKTLDKILDGEKMLAQNSSNLKSKPFTKSILDIAGDIIYLNNKTN